MATTYVDIFMTEALVITSPGGSVTKTFPGDTVSFQATSTFMYVSKYDGLDTSGLAFIPDTPAGYTLTLVKPFMKAHTVDGSSITITDDTSDWGYSPNPTMSPYLLVNHGTGYTLTFDTFPAGADPDDPIFNEIGDLDPTDDMFEDAVSFNRWGTDATKVVLSEYGWRFMYESEATAIPPRRIFQRRDGATHGGRSLFSDGPIPRRLGQRPL